MKVALDILRKAYADSGAMQHSIAATAYGNELKLAIQVLENYDKVFQQTIQKELDRTAYKPKEA